jgi:Sec-independent protein translocase protein TatA
LQGATIRLVLVVLILILIMVGGPFDISKIARELAQEIKAGRSTVVGTGLSEKQVREEETRLGGPVLGRPEKQEAPQRLGPEVWQG